VALSLSTVMVHGVSRGEVGVQVMPGVGQMFN